jgi:hypothetical protein
LIRSSNAKIGAEKKVGDFRVENQGDVEDLAEMGQREVCRNGNGYAEIEGWGM